jgi:hypothetical protein
MQEELKLGVINRKKKRTLSMGDEKQEHDNFKEI